MTRPAREKSRSGVYHVMLRGINKQTIFEDDEDKRRFLKTLLKYKEEMNFEIYGYCLMDNHVHLLLKENEFPVSEIIKRISASYVYWYNTKYERCGHLFQERFKSETVENASTFLRVLRYIHQNPLKAGIVTDVFFSEWTSIHEYLHNNSLLSTSGVLQLFSKDKSNALRLFKEYMYQTNDQEQFLEETRSVQKTDQEVLACIRATGIASTSMLQKMEKEQRNAILGQLKQIEGISARQIARVTGISRSVVQRVK